MEYFVESSLLVWLVLLLVVVVVVTDLLLDCCCHCSVKSQVEGGRQTVQWAPISFFLREYKREHNSIIR